jgi:hypothetical protein
VAAAILAGLISSGGPSSSPSAAHADPPPVVAAHVHAESDSPLTQQAPSGAVLARRRRCPLAIAPAGYVNPLAGAIVKPERIDQGVDYAGVGKLAAIGTARITELAAYAGWPGTFIEYQLLDGADAGCYVYYAEGVTPASGLHVGQTVSAGEPIATIIPVYPTGIELGWGAGHGSGTYANIGGRWSPTADAENVATAAGKNFSSLIEALGGPPGKVEG